MKKLLIFIAILLMFTPKVLGAEEEYNDDFRYSVVPDEPLLSEGTDLEDPESILKDLSFKRFLNYLLRLIGKSAKPALKNLLFGMAMVLFSVLLNRCGGNIQDKSLQMLFSFVISVSMTLMCEESLRQGACGLQESIENMKVFTTACIPSFSVVMIAAGEGASASVFSGILVLVGEIGTLISNHLLMPLTDVYLAIGLCATVSDEYNFSSIAKNIRRFMLWVISLLTIVFRLLLKLQSSATAAGDQLTKKYIKTAIGSMIPMVGNTISQGVDSLFTAAAGVKSSFAIAGVLMILSILMPALITIGLQGLVWSFCKWLAEFMNDHMICSVSGVLSNSFYLMLALGGCVGLMGLFSFFGIMSVV